MGTVRSASRDATTTTGKTSKASVQAPAIRLRPMSKVRTNRPRPSKP